MGFEKVIIGDATLYRGDCRDVLESIGPVDSLITDPPYGLGSLSGTTSKARNRNAYRSFEDSEQNIIDVVIPSIIKGLSLANGRGLVTCGVRCMFLYPRPRAIGGFYQPAAVGMSPWGFAGYNPVLFYGKDPRDGKGQTSVMTTLTEKSSSAEHPCAKPLGAMKWMIDKGSLPGEIVLDPFMGSATTGIAALQLGRKFIGIELDQEYFDLACKRIEMANIQPDMFIESKKHQIKLI